MAIAWFVGMEDEDSCLVLVVGALCLMKERAGWMALP